MHTFLNTHEWQNCNFTDPWFDERNFDYITGAAQRGELEQGVIMSTNAYAKATDLVPAPSCNVVNTDMVPATDMIPAAFLQGHEISSYNADWPCWQCSPSPAIELDSTFDYTINGIHAQDAQGASMSISPNTTSAFDYTINGTHAQDEQGAIMSISASTAANKIKVQSPPNPL